LVDPSRAEKKRRFRGRDGERAGVFIFSQRGGPATPPRKMPGCVCFDESASKLVKERECNLSPRGPPAALPTTITNTTATGKRPNTVFMMVSKPPRLARGNVIVNRNVGRQWELRPQRDPRTDRPGSYPRHCPKESCWLGPRANLNIHNKPPSAV